MALFCSKRAAKCSHLMVGTLTAGGNMLTHCVPYVVPTVPTVPTYLLGSDNRKGEHYTPTPLIHGIRKMVGTVRTVGTRLILLIYFSRKIGTMVGTLAHNVGTGMPRLFPHRPIQATETPQSCGDRECAP